MTLEPPKNRIIKPFVPNTPFIYPLKSSGNREVFYCLQGVKEGYKGKKWVNRMILYDIATSIQTIPAGNYMFKVNNRNTRTRCEICSKLTIKTSKRGQWRRFGAFFVNFEHTSHLVLVFLLLTLNM